MKSAKAKSKLVAAGPDTPDVAKCPDCGAEVVKRRRTCMDGTITYFYRHKRGQNKDCPRRYRPT